MIELALGLVAGAFLGLLGGGGSVIAVPILVYVLGLSTKSAIGTSLAVVALAGAVGSYAQYKDGLVNVKLAITFALVGAITSLAGAWIARFLSDAVQMITLAALMLAASAAMTLSKNRPPAAKPNKLVALGAAALVGILTGVVGVGGGFLLVPALSIFMALPVASAVATSLVIVAANSTVAGLAYMSYIPRDWPILAFALGMSIACPLTTRLITHFSETTLRRVFSIVLVLLACFILIKEV